MGIPHPLDQDPPLSFGPLLPRPLGRRKERAAHADRPHLEDAVAHGRKRPDETDEQSVGTELGQRDLLGAGALLQERLDLGQRRRAGVDLEQLEEAPRGPFGLPTDVEPHSGPPASPEVLHPVRHGPPSDPQFNEPGVVAGPVPPAPLRRRRGAGQGVRRVRDRATGRRERGGRDSEADALRFPSAITARRIPSTYTGGRPSRRAILRAPAITRAS